MFLKTMTLEESSLKVETCESKADERLRRWRGILESLKSCKKSNKERTDTQAITTAGC